MIIYVYTFHQISLKMSVVSTSTAQLLMAVYIGIDTTNQ